MILRRTTIEIGLDFPAYYLASDALAYCFALHLQQIMEFIEQIEVAAGRQVLSIEGFIDHQTGETWIAMLTLKLSSPPSRYAHDRQS